MRKHDRISNNTERHIDQAKDPHPLGIVHTRMEETSEVEDRAAVRSRYRRLRGRPVRRYAARDERAAARAEDRGAHCKEKKQGFHSSDDSTHLTSQLERAAPAAPIVPQSSLLSIALCYDEGSAL